MTAQNLMFGAPVSYQREGRINGGEYGVLDIAGAKPVMLWPGLNASFGVDIEEAYAEIQHTPAHGDMHPLECVRNVQTGENLPFHLETYPQLDMEFPLLEFITGSVTGLGEEPDSTSWLKEQNGEYIISTGIMFADYKCEIPDRGVVKETISGFAGDVAPIVEVDPAVTPAVENTTRPITWNDIASIHMGNAPNPHEEADLIDECLSDISFGFTSEIETRTHPDSALSTKICGVRVVSRKMFVSLKLAWADEAFRNIVQMSTKKYLKMVLGTGSHAMTIEFGGLLWPNYVSKSTAKEIAGDTITAITDQPIFTYSFAV